MSSKLVAYLASVFVCPAVFASANAPAHFSGTYLNSDGKAVGTAHCAQSVLKGSFTCDFVSGPGPSFDTISRQYTFGLEVGPDTSFCAGKTFSSFFCQALSPVGG